jgi:hypothetical protein
MGSNDGGIVVGRRYLQRVAAMLRYRHRFSDDDLRDVVSLALCGLIHERTTDAA